MDHKLKYEVSKGENLCDLALVKDFLDMTQSTNLERKIIINWTSSKFKDNINKMKRHI